MMDTVVMPNLLATSVAPLSGKRDRPTYRAQSHLDPISMIASPVDSRGQATIDGTMIDAISIDAILIDGIPIGESSIDGSSTEGTSIGANRRQPPLDPPLQPRRHHQSRLVHRKSNEAGGTSTDAAANAVPTRGGRVNHRLSRHRSRSRAARRNSNRRSGFLMPMKNALHIGGHANRVIDREPAHPARQGRAFSTCPVFDPPSSELRTLDQSQQAPPPRLGHPAGRLSGGTGQRFVSKGDFCRKQVSPLVRAPIAQKKKKNTE